MLYIILFLSNLFVPSCVFRLRTSPEALNSTTNSPKLFVGLFQLLFVFFVCLVTDFDKLFHQPQHRQKICLRLQLRSTLSFETNMWQSFILTNSLTSHLDKDACCSSFPLYHVPKMNNSHRHFVPLDCYRCVLYIVVHLRMRHCTLTKQTIRRIHHWRRQLIMISK